MRDFFKKGIETGIGLGMLTKEKVEEYAKKAAEEAKLKGKDAQRFIDDMMAKAEDMKSDLQKKIDETVAKAIDSAGLVKKEDLEKLEKRLEKLEKASKTKKTAATARKKTAAKKSTAKKSTAAPKKS